MSHAEIASDEDVISSSATMSSVTQFCFPLGGGRQGILFRLDRTLTRLFYPSGLSRVEFNVGLKLRRNVSLGVDGVHRAFIHASHAIDALLRVNNQLTVQLIKARHRADQYAVGELAPYTFSGNDMRHKLFLFQIDRAYESRLDERGGFANAFWGKYGRSLLLTQFQISDGRDQRSELQDINLSATRNFRDKRRLPLINGSSDSRESFHEIIGKRLCPQIALRGENKRANLRAPDGLLRSRAVTNAFVSRDDDPLVLSRYAQPLLVFGIRRKMIVVDLDLQSGFAQRARHLVTAKLAIEKESEFFRRLRRG
jgi:hypothetical protein